ncbi:hypothetical protein [Halobacillus naozhouensis]|uniref:Uncharacterized protein n=1 Tax=Halobacillus naozhouensis TaxID=554880 RepID=A0ABY8J4J9_9BACI|nr:hypothetical protein [Halobacillus naozhouensis]WFT75881.1 hypothetical protein P9989_05725 [Halobacillus naozhouensis]
MAFAVFFFTAWLITAIFFAIPKKLTLIENTFIFMLILVISINWSWIIYEGFKFIKITKEPMNYTGFLFFRSVTIPMLLVLQLNLIHRSKMFGSTAVITVLSVATLLLLDGLSIFFGITTYQKWNIFYDFLYFTGLHIVTYFFLWLFRKISYRGVDYS